MGESRYGNIVDRAAKKFLIFSSKYAAVWYLLTFYWRAVASSATVALGHGGSENDFVVYRKADSD
jgi:hypothetical protein